jgi:hypothetical protein
MMGQNGGNQNRLFYSFNLDGHVPANHLLRGINQFLDLSDLRAYLAPFYSHTGRRHALRSNWRPFKNARTHITKADTIIYRSSQFDCAACPLKARCCPKTLIRKITRSIYEPARDVARAVAKTHLYKQSRKDRKKVEMLFAHLKRILKLDRLRLRGPSGAHDEFLLAATAQNLRRMAKRLCPSPPRPAFGTA